MTAVALMGRETSRDRARHRGGAAAVAPPGRAGPTGAVGAGRVRRAVPPRRRAVAPLDHRLACSVCPTSNRPSWCADYLDVFDAMFDGPNPVDVENDHFRIHNPLDVTDLPVPVFLAALGPVMLRLAGERAAGTVLWMADERAIAEHVVPKITKAAADAGRPAPRVVAGVRGVPVRVERGRRARSSGPTTRSGTPSTRRTTSGCSRRVRPTTSATCRRSAPRPTSSADCAPTWTPAPPTSRRASCRWGATRTRSWRRRGARASSWRRWRPSSRDRDPAGRSPLAVDPRDGPRRRVALRRRASRSSMAVVASRSPSWSPTPRRVTAGLIATGLEPGERAAVWSPNRYEWLVAALGILGAGGAVVPVNTRFKGEEVRYILDRSGARVAFTVGEFLGVDYAATLAGLRSELPNLLTVVRLRRRHRGRPVVARVPGDRRRRRRRTSSTLASARSAATT